MKKPPLEKKKKKRNVLKITWRTRQPYLSCISFFFSSFFFFFFLSFISYSIVHCNLFHKHTHTHTRTHIHICMHRILYCTYSHTKLIHTQSHTYIFSFSLFFFSNLLSLSCVRWLSLFNGHRTFARCEDMWNVGNNNVIITLGLRTLLQKCILTFNVRISIKATSVQYKNCLSINRNSRML